MKKRIMLFLSILTSAVAIAQSENIDSIVVEGKRLYRLEMTSWNGTDIFLEKFKGQESKIGGYISYESEKLNTCVFYSKGETPTVLATINLDSTFNMANAIVKEEARSFTRLEQNLISLRSKAMAIVKMDTFFRSYNNSDLNIIPTIANGMRTVYVLTGPKDNGVVIVGNDYFLTFDENNNLTSKRQLHRNIIPIEFGKEKMEVIATMHTHQPETGEFITATDICTLMLYGKFAKWSQHLVIANKNISIWDFDTNRLTTMTKDAWDKISKDSKTRKNRK